MKLKPIVTGFMVRLVLATDHAGLAHVPGLAFGVHPLTQCTQGTQSHVRQH